MKPSLRHRLPLLVALLAGAALRLFRLGADSLWYDETVSTALAGSPLPELLRYTAGDIHPPGYYLLLRGWLALTGYPAGRADPHGNGLEFVAGFFSLCFGVLLIALVYALARRVANRQVGLIAALLVALSPYNVWYSQEVRMYTLGAGLGVVTVYALLRALTNQRIGESANQHVAIRSFAHSPFAPWWAIYAVAAAAGMYTLYYFVFLLIPLNLWVLWRIADGRWQMADGGWRMADGRWQMADGRWRMADGRWRMADSRWWMAKRSTPHAAMPNIQPSASSFRPWLLANMLAALFYAPWIPVAWRQATNPPVPPWRTAPDLLAALRESWTALSLGQSAPAWLWPALLLTLALYALGLMANRRINESKNGESAQHALRNTHYAIRNTQHAALPLSTFAPLALILLISLITPLYHVRYLFTYSPAFYVVLAAGLAWLLRRSRVAFGVAAVCWLAAAGVTLHAFWADPAYRADDHRAAMRFLQERWRPGDVVLVNAGWSYTALTTYWNGPIASRSRLTGDLPAAPDDPAALAMITTGHVDGDPGLGWGDPGADFFAMPADAARGQIAALFDRFERVWQYRIYDTVNDPAGDVRGWLARDGQLFDDQVFAGEANMRVQGYMPRQAAATDPSWPSAALGAGLTVRVRPLPGQTASGETLYPALDWQFTAAPADFATSIRLVGPDGAVWAQPPDERPSGPQLPAGRWAVGQVQRQTLVLPVPPGTPPGRYTVELVIYDPATGAPWPAQAGDLALTPNGLRLGEVTIVRPAPPRMQPALVTFGPLALIAATSPATTIATGGQVPVELLWQAITAPGEPLIVVVQLQDAAGHVAAGMEAQPLDGRYPTQAWAAGELVRDRHTLALPAGLAPGAYRLIVGVYRAGDRARLETKVGLFGRSDHWVVGAVDVKPSAGS